MNQKFHVILILCMLLCIVNGDQFSNDASISNKKKILALRKTTLLSQTKKSIGIKENEYSISNKQKIVALMKTTLLSQTKNSGVKIYRL